MRRPCCRWLACAAALALLPASLLLAAGPSAPSSSKPSSVSLQLDSIDGLELVDGKAEAVTYKGRRALHLLPLADHGPDDLAGSPRPGSDAGSRGFIGVMFRAQQRGERGENIYLRPTNGRADDQLRRNHATQYESVPDYPWYRLRKENPGVYESYVDLQAGEWTHMKIVVSGTKAQLYVNGAEQPCLIVNDLKLGEGHGRIALWAHSSTDGYFSNLTIRSN
jgi:hypothetical protein